MQHDYKQDCQCYRCKGIRNDPRNKPYNKPRKARVYKEKYASCEEQYGRYIDCGHSNWDDR